MICLDRCHDWHSTPISLYVNLGEKGVGERLRGSNSNWHGQKWPHDESGRLPDWPTCIGCSDAGIRGAIEKGSVFSHQER